MAKPIPLSRREPMSEEALNARNRDLKRRGYSHPEGGISGAPGKAPMERGGTTGTIPGRGKTTGTSAKDKRR